MKQTFPKQPEQPSHIEKARIPDDDMYQWIKTLYEGGFTEAEVEKMMLYLNDEFAHQKLKSLVDNELAKIGQDMAVRGIAVTEEKRQVLRRIFLDALRQLNPRELVGGEESNIRWYKKALDKAEQLLPSIDPELNVKVTPVSTVLPSGEPHESLTLFFQHSKKPNMGWMAEIVKSDDFIENHLEDYIRRSYKFALEKIQTE